VFVRASRRVRKALYEFASTLGWTDLRRPFFGSMAVRGMWNGRAGDRFPSPPGEGSRGEVSPPGAAAAFGWQAAQKSTPAYVSAEIAFDRAGRFEIRARAARRNFLQRPIMLFGPPRIDLFDPADAARYDVWASDRTLVDSLLAVPGIRERLDANLAGGGVLSLRNARLRIRRPLRTAPQKAFRFRFKVGPDLDRVRAIAGEEWALLTMAPE